MRRCVLVRRPHNFRFLKVGEGLQPSSFPAPFALLFAFDLRSRVILAGIGSHDLQRPAIFIFELLRLSLRTTCDSNRLRKLSQTGCLSILSPGRESTTSVFPHHSSRSPQVSLECDGIERKGDKVQPSLSVFLLYALAKSLVRTRQEEGNRERSHTYES